MADTRLLELTGALELLLRGPGATLCHDSADEGFAERTADSYPGTLLISEWQVTQDLPLLVGEVFLATVSCEPAGEKLGIRINSFDQPAHGL